MSGRDNRMPEMSGLDLEQLKDTFTSLVGRAEPGVLPAFLLWVDIKVAEYKCNGYMYSDPNSRYEGPWLKFAVDTVRYKLGSKSESGNHYGMSPDTTVQTEALELTKSPEKPKQLPYNGHKDVPIYNITPQDTMYSSSPAKTALRFDGPYPGDAGHYSNHPSPVYPKESASYSNHHSPVYGSEASGIINLSVKSSQYSSQSHIENHAATTPAPLKLTLKVPSVYNSMGSPSKPSSVESSPVKRERLSDRPMEHTMVPDAYSSLRSLLSVNKMSEFQASPNMLPSHITQSPIKSDNDSNASSPGPAELDVKETKKSDCPYCGKTFQYRSSFRRHMKIHQGVYTHICAACNRKFTRKEHFVRHKCNRKPNIPNRSASRVEVNPDALPVNGKLPEPKVAYPPTLDDQSAILTEPDHYSQNSPKMEEDPDSRPLVIDESATKHIQAAESRRKKSQPRRVVTVAGESRGNDSFLADIADDSDMMEAYDSPRPASEDHYRPEQSYHDSPTSPTDLSNKPVGVEPKFQNDVTPNPYQNHTQMPAFTYPNMEGSPAPYYNATPDAAPVGASRSDSYPSHTDSKGVPMEMTPREADTISTNTGTYQIQQVEDDTSDNCIKVTKQSNYLKLRKEAQLINGQMCFVCPHCTKIFHRSSNFSRHMRIHRGIYSYICNQCNRGFYRKEHFQKHKCARKSMSRIWSRKTKVDMDQVDGEKENVEVPGGVEALEDGIDLSSESGEELDSGTEEGALVVDESAPEQLPEVSSAPTCSVPVLPEMER